MLNSVQTIFQILSSVSACDSAPKTRRLKQANRRVAKEQLAEANSPLKGILSP
jgi:hypothetical protein